MCFAKKTLVFRPQRQNTTWEQAFPVDRRKCVETPFGRTDRAGHRRSDAGARRGQADTAYFIEPQQFRRRGPSLPSVDGSRATGLKGPDADRHVDAVILAEGCRESASQSNHPGIPGLHRAAARRCRRMSRSGSRWSTQRWNACTRLDNAIERSWSTTSRAW
jgi:hypothetical protein